MKKEFCSRLATRIRERRYTAHDAARLFWICYLSLLAMYSTRYRTFRVAVDPKNRDHDPGSAGRVSSSMEDICDFLVGETKEMPHHASGALPAGFPFPAVITGTSGCGRVAGLSAGNVPVAAASCE